ncbi:MAG: proteasome accessory factor PafA2 family protein [Armatimonadetes bacterium]|nr:proteasome accessory factor PafA2 family protein [Armatimonadota bacterium]MDE2207871.1 proteasome accessory factor PafA2 family protein [Armatimonadota bacterium]
MEKRIVGIETEFGCMVQPEAGMSPEDAVDRVRDHAFYERALGLLDLHARDYAFEPMRAGGFLKNGARLYVDAVGSHEEYATPECCDIIDLVAHDRAGRVLLAGIVRDMGLQDVISFHSNSIDHFAGHTFGCHENYLVQIEDNAYSEALTALIPFLITRQIYAGTGRVGGHRLTRPGSKTNVMTVGEHEVDYVWVSNFYGVELDSSVDFQLSQRADHIVKTVSSRVRFNRAIINPKWDSYYSYSNLHRLHILFGESNMSEYACMLKCGATSLALDLVEEGLAPTELQIADPLMALRRISRDPKWRWVVELTNGRTIRAVDLQRAWLAAAKKRCAGAGERTEMVLAEWERTLNDLEVDPLSTADRLDWSAKYRLYSRFIQETGGSWHDDAMQSVDLEYHNIDPERGLSYELERIGDLVRLTTDDQVAAAVENPPDDTRAFGRAAIIRHLLKTPGLRYLIDWDAVYIERSRQLELKNPFSTYAREATRFIKGL